MSVLHRCDKIKKILFGAVFLRTGLKTVWIKIRLRKGDKQECRKSCEDYREGAGEGYIMILSVSRRTDIPNYYFDWFCRRLREGYLYVRNPMNERQVSRIDLSPEAVEGMVFWTKNPAAMMGRLGEIEKYPYYVQFTLTGYGRDVEPGLPDKQQVLLERFRELSRAIGRRRVIWRYDPILFNRVYTPDYHRKAFAAIAGSLEGYTERAVISFVDMYTKIRKNMAALQVRDLPEGELALFAGQLAAVAREHGMTVESCSEAIDLEAAGIRHGSCIDPGLMGEIMDCRILARKDKNQRKECGCMESVDVGTYNTCHNGCRYCYANLSQGAVRSRTERYDPDSLLLCGAVGPDDRVTLQKRRSVADGQMIEC